MGDRADGTFAIGGDLTVRRLGFGAMRITGQGIWGRPKDVPNAIAVLRRAVELGVDLIDTADAYGPDVSEELIAEALHPYKKGLVIATKGGLTRGGPSDWSRNARPEHLRNACEGSLKRLRVAQIDVYQLHAPDPAVPFEDSVGALADLKKQGKIRHVALSNVSVELIERARSIVPIVSVQNKYSVWDRGADAVVDHCEKHGIGFLPYFPLAAGDLDSRGKRLAAVAQKHGATPPQIALAWLLARSPVMLPIPGTSSLEHLDENMRAAKIALDAGEVKQLAG